MRIAIIMGLIFLSHKLYAVGDAGCGLGSVLISRNSKGLQLLAMTTNGTTLSQLFGITSGTSNCSSTGLVSNDQEKEAFVAVNKEDLMKSIARGSGESLLTFARLNGCVSATAKAEFAKTLKENMPLVVGSAASSSQIVSTVNVQIQNHPKLKWLCTTKI